MCLGGGVIAVSGDGGLRQWQIQNEVSHNGHVPDSFWAIKLVSSLSCSLVLLFDLSSQMLSLLKVILYLIFF